MTSHRPLVVAGALAAAFALPAVSCAQSPAQLKFRAMVDAVYDAIAGADSAKLRPWLADDLRWTTNSSAVATQSQLLSDAGRRQAPLQRFEIDSLEVQRVGGVTLVSYRRVDRREFGDAWSLATWRVMDVFTHRGGRWHIVRHTQTWLASPVRSVTLDSASMQPFVGRYRIAPGVIDEVRWLGGHLVATVTGFPPAVRLVPVSESVFSPDGIGALIAFERDATGRVTGYVQGHPDGRVVRRVRER